MSYQPGSILLGAIDSAAIRLDRQASRKEEMAESKRRWDITNRQQAESHRNNKALLTERAAQMKGWLWNRNEGRDYSIGEIMGDASRKRQMINYFNEWSPGSLDTTNGRHEALDLVEMRPGSRQYSLVMQDKDTGKVVPYSKNRLPGEAPMMFDLSQLGDRVGSEKGYIGDEATRLQILKGLKNEEGVAGLIRDESTRLGRHAGTGAEDISNMARMAYTQAGVNPTDAQIKAYVEGYRGEDYSTPEETPSTEASTSAPESVTPPPPTSTPSAFEMGEKQGTAPNSWYEQGPDEEPGLEHVGVAEWFVGGGAAKVAPHVGGALSKVGKAAVDKAFGKGATAKAQAEVIYKLRQAGLIGIVVSYVAVKYGVPAAMKLAGKNPVGTSMVAAGAGGYLFSSEEAAEKGSAISATTIEQGRKSADKNPSPEPSKALSRQIQQKVRANYRTIANVESMHRTGQISDKAYTNFYETGSMQGAVDAAKSRKKHSDEWSTLGEAFAHNRGQYTGKMDAKGNRQQASAAQVAADYEITWDQSKDFVNLMGMNFDNPTKSQKTLFAELVEEARIYDGTFNQDDERIDTTGSLNPGKVFAKAIKENSSFTIRGKAITPDLVKAHIRLTQQQEGRALSTEQALAELLAAVGRLPEK